MGLELASTSPAPPGTASLAAAASPPRAGPPARAQEVIVVEADSDQSPSQGPPSAMKKRAKSVEFSEDIQLVKKPNSSNPTDPPKILFGKKAINNHGLVPLLKYWDKALKDFDTYIPLSVFNPTWLRQDLLEIPIKKKNQKEKLDEYVGLSVPY